MQRRTKIICTLGPASSEEDTIRELIQAGMDVARLNFSHGTHDFHRQMIEKVRRIAEQEDRHVSILQDLQGPKIRVGPVQDGAVLVQRGHSLIITNEPLEESNSERIHISYPNLAHDVQVGKHILIDDGLLELKVKAIEGEDVVTEVVVGGTLRSQKGVNLPHIRNTTPSLTQKDLHDLQFGLAMNVDIIALSFVRTREDVQDLMRLVRESGKQVSVVAKIEKPEAVENIDEILEEADGLMVARGDLGIEMSMADLPSAQKMIIHKCLAQGKPVITATQMLESMVENPRPTRAEASDVANAVLDGSDAVMLSGETAMGKHPPRVVEVMAGIICGAEAHRRNYQGGQALLSKEAVNHGNVNESIAYTACMMAEQVGAVAIAALTSLGGMARLIARHRPRVPIYAFTDNERVVGHLGLLWGTKAFAIPFQHDTDHGIWLIERILTGRGLAQNGDLVVITAGMPLPARAATNTVHVNRIGQNR